MSKKYIFDRDEGILNINKRNEDFALCSDESCKRFFVEKCDIGNVVIDGEEHNHLSNVMRLKIGDEVTLICNNEYDYHGKITEINKKFTVINVISKDINKANPSVEITAFVAVNKKEPTSLMIRMLSELGVSNYVPLKTKWTQAQDEKINIERYQKIADQSAKQCRRSKTLKILEMQTLEDACKNLNQFDVTYFAYEKENIDENFLNNKLGKDQIKKIAFIIGPVAGFDKDEANLIIKSGAKSISLGKRILKADTACIALASLITNYFDN